MNSSKGHKRSDGLLPIIELFGPTIQGEGDMAGSISHFVRFGGCDYRCLWCDTMYAVDPTQVQENSNWMSPTAIFKALKQLQPAPIVSLTGGNPAMWDLSALVGILKDNYVINVETQGSMFREWFHECDLITVSPKGPSSGMLGLLNWNELDKFYKLFQDSRETDVTFKVVVFDEDDFQFAKEVRKRYALSRFHLSAGTPQRKEPVTSDDTVYDILTSYRYLCDRVLRDPTMADVKVLPQLHALIWPQQKGH